MFLCLKLKNVKLFLIAKFPNTVNMLTFLEIIKEYRVFFKLGTLIVKVPHGKNI